MARDAIVVAVTGLVLLSMFAAPAVVSGSEDENDTLKLAVGATEATPGGNVTLTVRLENVATRTVSEPEISLGYFPEGWNVTGEELYDGWWTDGPNTVKYLGIRPDDTARVEITFQLPENASGSYLFTVSASSNGGNEVSVRHRVNVSEETDDGGDDPDEEKKQIDVDGDGNASADPNDDGYHEDVDGDGDFDVFDVEAFFDDVTGDETTVGHARYDFDGSGEVDIFDVLTLFNRL